MATAADEPVAVMLGDNLRARLEREGGGVAPGGVVFADSAAEEEWRTGRAAERHDRMEERYTITRRTAADRLTDAERDELAAVHAAHARAVQSLTEATDNATAAAEAVRAAIDAEARARGALDYLTRRAMDAHGLGDGDAITLETGAIVRGGA